MGQRGLAALARLFCNESKPTVQKDPGIGNISWRQASLSANMLAVAMPVEIRRMSGMW